MVLRESMTLKHIVITLTLLAPSSALAQGYQTPAQVSENLNREARSAAALAQVWQGIPNRACSDEIITTARSRLDGVLSTLRDAADRSSTRGLSETSYWRANTVLSNTAPVAAKAQLDLAGAYLKGGCPAEAKVVYQDVISTFTGSNYAAYRQLASEGLADIRASQ